MNNITSLEEIRNKKAEKNQKILEEKLETYMDETESVFAEYNRDRIKTKAGLKGMTLEETLAVHERYTAAKEKLDEHLDKMITPEERQAIRDEMIKTCAEMDPEKSREMEEDLEAIYGTDEELFGKYENLGK